MRCDRPRGAASIDRRVGRRRRISPSSAVVSGGPQRESAFTRPLEFGPRPSSAAACVPSQSGGARCPGDRPCYPGRVHQHQGSRACHLSRPRAARQPSPFNLFRGARARALHLGGTPRRRWRASLPPGPGKRSRSSPSGRRAKGTPTSRQAPSRYRPPSSGSARSTASEGSHAHRSSLLTNPARTRLSALTRKAVPRSSWCSLNTRPRLRSCSPPSSRQDTAPARGAPR